MILDNIESTDDPSYLKIVVKSFVIPALVFNLFNLVLFLLSKYLKSISWSVFPNSIKDFAVSLKLNNSHFSMLLSVTLEGNAFRASFISIWSFFDPPSDSCTKQSKNFSMYFFSGSGITNNNKSSSSSSSFSSSIDG